MSNKQSLQTEKITIHIGRISFNEIKCIAFFEQCKIYIECVVMYDMANGVFVCKSGNKLNHILKSTSLKRVIQAYLSKHQEKCHFQFKHTYMSHISKRDSINTAFGW